MAEPFIQLDDNNNNNNNNDKKNRKQILRKFLKKNQNVNMNEY